MDENMNVKNDELDESEFDSEITAPDDAESDSNYAEKTKGRKPGEKYIQKTAMITLNDTMRIYISEGERSMHFQRKSKNDESDNWFNDGYFCNFDSLLAYVIQICTKEKIYTKQTRDYTELKNTFKEIKADMKVIAEIINESIRNNDYLKELREM